MFFAKKGCTVGAAIIKKQLGTYKERKKERHVLENFSS